MKKRVDCQRNITQVPTEADSHSDVGKMHQRTQRGPKGGLRAEESIFYPVKTSLK